MRMGRGVIPVGGAGEVVRKLHGVPLTMSETIKG